MFPRGLKSNIAINIAAVLLLGMLLIGFVTIITTQRDFVRYEISKGSLLFSVFEDHLFNFSKPLNGNLFLRSQHNLDKLLDEAGFSCALVLDKNEKQIYFGGTRCVMENELVNLTRQTIHTGKQSTKFLGSVWGVFWKQSQTMIISAPLIRDSHIIGATGIVLPLEDIYRVLRRSQKILLIYILINTVILTFIGLYRLSKIYFQPMRRLVKRAEEYREDDELFFSARKEDNELHQLSKALNRMLERISEDKQKLRSTVQSLEKANLDLKKAQKEIVQAEKLASVGRLSSGIAHEIGNPIGIIMGYLELLKQKSISEDEKNEYIIRTEDEINRINTIIRQLLDLSRPSNVGAKAISVHDIIDDITKVVQFQPLMSKIQLIFFLEAKDDRVIADPNQLRQVFLNLIINAADAISSNENERKGELIIKSAVASSASDPNGNTTEDQPFLQVMYIDNGPGIPPENIGNIFDPFFTTKEVGKGTGLGLSVSFMIVESIGGTIRASSEVGKGTTMTLFLPLANSYR